MDNNNMNQYSQNQPTGQQYQAGNGPQLEPPLSLGNWIIILLLTAIPCVNIIILLIWAFGRDVNTTKKNYSRAALIFMLIGFVISLIFSSIFATIFSSLGGYYY